MIYIYKNSKRISLGDLPTFIYLDNENNVVVKSYEKVEGYGDPIVGCSQIFNYLVPVGRQQGYYHRLIEGKKGCSIDDYERVYDIDKLKQEKCIEIDARTDELIANGISFDGNLFSASAEAQRNWIAMYAAREDLPYPFSVTTLDEKEYTFTDPRFVQVFYLTGVSTINYQISSGRALKLQVMECATKECVDSIVDTR